MFDPASREEEWYEKGKLEEVNPEVTEMRPDAKRVSKSTQSEPSSASSIFASTLAAFFVLVSTVGKGKFGNGNFGFFFQKSPFRS